MCVAACKGGTVLKAKMVGYYLIFIFFPVITQDFAIARLNYLWELIDSENNKYIKLALGSKFSVSVPSKICFAYLVLVLMLENSVSSNTCSCFSQSVCWHPPSFFWRVCLWYKILMRWKPGHDPLPIPALSCWPMSNFVLPQKAPSYSAQGRETSFLFSALCCPHATETVLLKLEKECLDLGVHIWEL